jgi:hypothetical protein
MGTFHQDKGELNGVTVVVDTKGPKVFIGRFWEEDAEKIVLLDADEFEDGKRALEGAVYPRGCEGRRLEEARPYNRAARGRRFGYSSG